MLKGVKHTIIIFTFINYLYMDSTMLKNLKYQNLDKDYTSNVGQKWNDEEETLLIDELDKNIDIDTIAKNHNRTTYGINTRCKYISYKMHLQN